ncbi:MAG: DUF2437 domain-containing protein, partial [Clostridia bacterium]|nr:DUF2437 domain-containing protein [Clostridia bacterium]
MKIVRAQVNDESEVFYGVLEGGTVKRLVQAPYEDIKYDGREYETDKLKLLAPTAPSKIVCVGKNYFDHCEELKGEINDGSGIDDPILFIK